jgi:hypothetical protein
LIIVITTKEKDIHGNYVEIISHGVNSVTLQNVCLPQEPIGGCNFIIFNKELNSYVVKD